MRRSGLARGAGREHSSSSPLVGSLFASWCLLGGGTEVSTWSLPLTGGAILGDTEMPQLPGKAHAWGRMSQGLMAGPPTASRDCQEGPGKPEEGAVRGCRGAGSRQRCVCRLFSCLRLLSQGEC